jgi:hypothetical protein
MRQVVDRSSPRAR